MHEKYITYTPDNKQISKSASHPDQFFIIPKHTIPSLISIIIIS